MRNRPAFTIVELLVTLVAMTILMTLAVVSFKSVQVDARDTEREADVKNIARGLEQRYKEGNPVATAPAPDVQKGSYPGINEALHIDGWARAGYTPESYGGNYRRLAFPGTEESSFTNPEGEFAWTQICVYGCALAGDTTQINNAMNGEDRYVYEPIDKNGGVCCCGECIRFNIYWRKEVDGSLQKVKSLHQQ
ncbi:hypothetical protein RAAC3_TM7C00001G0109 [Candidatus Saccharibacteria bacterium RAAC3_TM7_1]|nr:hypothetical protein RAAC3_TM7C00001G0109 [Candidatus Saccharibacteria bacterium RAAC3_TM7_1]HCZ28234.1 type II secretion system protein [Candidatus Saccharibacteria bacterium]